MRVYVQVIALLWAICDLWVMENLTKRQSVIMKSATMNEIDSLGTASQFDGNFLHVPL